MYLLGCFLSSLSVFAVYDSAKVKQKEMQLNHCTANKVDVTLYNEDDLD